MAQLPGAPCLPESREQYPRERKGDLLDRHTAVSPEKRHVPHMASAIGINLPELHQCFMK
jgi:hypothetical protein